MPDEYVTKEMFKFAHNTIKEGMEKINIGIDKLDSKLDNAVTSAALVEQKTETNEKCIANHKKTHYAFITIVLAVLLIIGIASGIVVSVMQKPNTTDMGIINE